MEAAACALRDGTFAGPQAQLSIRSFAVRRYQDFPAAGETPSEQSVTGALVRIAGPVPGAGLFSVGSEAALQGVAEGSASVSATETFLSLGRCVLEAFASSAVAALLERSEPLEIGPASLAEASRPAILLGTHAPGDTVLVSLGIDLLRGPGDETLAVFIDFLLEPKQITLRLG